MLNRSIICKVANKLRKGGYTLSQAFRMAWKLAKGKASVKVAGVTKERRQEAIEHLSRYNPETVSFILNRESDNQYDRNAIAVYASVGSGKAYKMGYISAAVACLLSSIIDKHYNRKCTLTGYYRRFLRRYGAGLEIITFNLTHTGAGDTVLRK